MNAWVYAVAWGIGTILLFALILLVTEAYGWRVWGL
jgi:hypothetical protein